MSAWPAGPSGEVWEWPTRSAQSLAASVSKSRPAAPNLCTSSALVVVFLYRLKVNGLASEVQFQVLRATHTTFDCEEIDSLYLLIFFLSLSSVLLFFFSCSLLIH